MANIELSSFLALQHLFLTDVRRKLPGLDRNRLVSVALDNEFFTQENRDKLAHRSDLLTTFDYLQKLPQAVIPWMTLQQYHQFIEYHLPTIGRKLAVCEMTVFVVGGIGTGVYRLSEQDDGWYSSLMHFINTDHPYFVTQIEQLDEKHSYQIITQLDGDDLETHVRISDGEGCRWSEWTKWEEHDTFPINPFKLEMELKACEVELPLERFEKTRKEHNDVDHSNTTSN